MKKLIALLLSIIMLTTTACTASVNEERAETTLVTAEEENVFVPDVTYNVIFTLATIPPVLSALDAISSGNETYAIIERGKTYSGIEKLEKFHNVGFDPANNLSTGFTAEEMNAMVAKVKELNESAENAFFNFYTQDGTALTGAAIAANAGLKKNQFHVYMVEDGTGAYSELYTTYLQHYSVENNADGIYSNYCTAVNNAHEEFDAIMSKTDNQITDPALGYNIGKAFALASLNNFTYYIQDEARIIEILENPNNFSENLLASFCVDGYEAEVDYKLNLKYQKIVDGVDALSEEEKTDYLTLMYGQYFEDTYANLTRAERAGEEAPSKKLVFIGTRHSGYPTFASNEKHGIGGMTVDQDVPATYEELDEKYKSPLLFGCKEDYDIFLSALNNPQNYEDNMTEDIKKNVRVATFNNYIDYIFSLKFTYLQYGQQYDLIMKGHPREVIGSNEEWGDSYAVTAANGEIYRYNKLMDKTLLNFHAADSVGKYIGMVPYGTAAENLAYLGADMSICGLPSSTYNGYDTSVDVLFILAETNQDIMGSGEADVVSSVSTRYEAENLHYTDVSGETSVTGFFNTGNVYKAAVAICEANNAYDTAAMYAEQYETWLAEVHDGASGVDAQGFPIEVK